MSSQRGQVSEQGQMIVLAYMGIFVLTVLGASVLNSSFSVSRHSQIDQLQSDVFYVAEGGVEDASAKFAQAIANFQVDSNTPRYPAVGSLVTTFASGATANSVVTEAEAAPRTIVDPDGVSVFTKNYEIVTTAQHPTNPAVTATIHQVVSRRIIYTFQHAVFYDNDLEWLPGANMTLMGRVHSNNDIYLATEANKTLTVDSEYLRAVGSLLHRRKDNASVPSGIVEIKKAGSSPELFPVLTFDSTSGSWAADSQTTWAGTVQTGVHGVTKRAVPVVGSTNPGGFYDTNADVQIVDGVIKKGGVVLVQGTDIPAGTITTSTTLYNNREGKTVKTTDVDLRKLGGYVDVNGDGVFEAPGTGGNPFTNKLPANGLLYATRTDATSGQQPGIRLRNGATIYRTGGLTVVSNDPVYIQGDYNTVAKKPAAVIGDAMNLLSSNWNDSNSAGALSGRTANSTTFNAAFIAGIKTTTSGSYNGGLENYPRLHENWSSKQLTITGSFVSLWNSQIAIGNWTYGAPYYTAPVRIWSYDTAFSSGTQLPPFTPFAVEMKRGAWWKE